MRELLINILGRCVSYLIRAHNAYVYNNYRRRYSLEKTFVFNGDGILMYGDGVISIGKYSYVGRCSTLQASDNASIEIGSNCKIGPFFSVWTHSSEVDCDYMFDEKIKPKIGDIIIEDGVWIGANVVITPGVRIGRNSIIGANSVVTKDIDDFSIVGGVPARLIRYKRIDD